MKSGTGGNTRIMGILNLTPDSFSGDGLAGHGQPVTAALELAQKFVQAGADILDVGGESTRPGASPVSESEEIERILPVVSALAQQYPDTILSVDTYKAGVAEAALRAGAHWVNDVWGLKADPDLAGVIASHGAGVVIMHNRSRPEQAASQPGLGGQYIGVQYENLIEDIKKELMESVNLAVTAGIPSERIILDPGIGFGKTVAQNLELINRLDEIRALGFPVLAGPSRKGFIGYTLNLPPEQRLEGTAAAAVIAIVRGADIIRVHDVEFMVRLARMTDAILRSGASNPAAGSPERI